MKRAALIVVFLLFTAALASAQNVRGLDFPYGRIQLRTSPQENPYSGLGNNYSALALGIDSMMWNPAGLSKVKLGEISFAALAETANPEFTYTYALADPSLSAGSANVNFRAHLTSDRTVSAVATREHVAHANYATKGTGVNFKQAVKVNDFLSFGIISRGETGANLDLAGTFPLVTKLNATFTGQNLAIGSRASISIDSSGYPTLVVTPEGGSTYTSRLEAQLWSGFLRQTSTVPYTTYLEARNDVTVNSNLTMAGAAKWGKLSVGVGLTPITANANINNDARVVAEAGTPDMAIYLPNVSADEQELLNWSQDPNQYGTELGYRKNTIRVPAGEIVAEAKFKGFYQASAVRTDVGLTYDFSDSAAVGLVLENFGGATLDFRGTGRIAYVNSRIGSLEVPSLDPSGSFNWAIFRDTSQALGGTENWGLEEQLRADLPRRMRLGFTLKGPLLLAFDFEQNQSPIKYKYADSTGATQTLVISNLNFIRIGLDLRLLRISSTIMLKPTLTNASTDQQTSVNQLFRYRVLPLDLNLGSEWNLWGVIVDSGTGFNFSPLLSLAQADTLNADLNKLVYYDLALKYGQWQLSYLASLDPGSTGVTYSARPTGANFDTSMIKWIQTLTVSFKF